MQYEYEYEYDSEYKYEYEFEYKVQTNKVWVRVCNPCNSNPAESTRLYAMQFIVK
jgi:hypothetical protein